MAVRYEHLPWSQATQQLLFSLRRARQERPEPGVRLLRQNLLALLQDGARLPAPLRPPPVPPLLGREAESPGRGVRELQALGGHAGRQEGSLLTPPGGRDSEELLLLRARTTAFGEPAPSPASPRGFGAPRAHRIVAGGGSEQRAEGDKSHNSFFNEELVFRQSRAPPSPRLSR